MAGKLGKFQLRGFTGWADITRDNHLSAMWQRQPQRATDVMIQLLAYNHGTSLESFLNQFPTKEFEDDDTVYQWRPIGTSDKPFGGRIEITIANADTLMNFGLDVTLFDYIMDSVEIVNVNGNNQLFSLVKTNTSITIVLFANISISTFTNLITFFRDSIA